MSTVKYFAFDLETSGLDPERGAEILSFAFILLGDKLEVLEEGEAFILPTRPVASEAAKVNGYTRELWEERGAMPLAEFKDVLVGLLREYKCKRVKPLGHNVAFDLGFLHYEGRKDPGFGLVLRDALNFKSTCTLNLASEIDEAWQVTAPSYKLGELTRRYGITLDNAHDALADIRATVALHRALLQQIKRGEAPPAPPPASFLELRGGAWCYRVGRHKGKTLEEAGYSYATWAYNEVDLPSDERRALGAQIQRFKDAKTNASVRVGGKPFACPCGCAVFTKSGPQYECNSCRALYHGTPDAGRSTP
jgi:DNA polymerase-3 subunit epsilon